MISGVTKVTLTCRQSQTDLLCQTAFCIEHEAPNIGLWGHPRTSAATGCPKLPQLEQLVHIVKGGQPERRVLDRFRGKSPEAFITLTLLTSLQPMVCRMLWVLRAGDAFFYSKALIKLEKTREEPKSTAAGERKELMLKSKDS